MYELIDLFMVGHRMLCAPHVHDLIASNDNIFRFNVLQPNLEPKKNNSTWFPHHFTWAKMSLESTTPPTLAKRNSNTHATHNTPPTNTKENQILLRTFQNYMNKIIQLNTSLEKEDFYSMKIIKPPIYNWRSWSS